MVEAALLREMIHDRRAVTIRLLEGRDIFAIVLSQDADTLLVQRPGTGERSLIYKRAVSVITPTEGQEITNEHDTNEVPDAGHQPPGGGSGRGGAAPL